MTQVDLDLSSREALIARDRLARGQFGRIAAGSRSWRCAADVTSASSGHVHSAGMQQRFAFIGDVRGNSRILDQALEKARGW